MENVETERYIKTLEAKEQLRRLREAFSNFGFSMSQALRGFRILGAHLNLARKKMDKRQRRRFNRIIKREQK